MSFSQSVNRVLIACWPILRPPRQIKMRSIEIVIAFDYSNLRGELAELGLLSNLRCDGSVIFMNSVGQRLTLFRRLADS